MLTNVSHVLYVILSSILSTLFIVLNAATIYVFYQKFRLTTVCTILIVNICVCDIFVCLITNPFYMYNLMDPDFAWRTGSLCCRLFKFLTMFANVAQIYFFCFLTADCLRRLVYARIDQWQNRHGILFMVIGWTAAIMLTSPRLVLFEEQIAREVLPGTNKTVVANVNCKPIGLHEDGYVASTVLLFTLGYAFPAFFIAYSAVRRQLFMQKRRHTIHIPSTSNLVTKMKNKLSLTFNLLAMYFILIWTPFFLLSVIDLAMNLQERKDLVHINFTLRCSLLILGSGKPVIHLICLEKFRSNFPIGCRCGSINVDDQNTSMPPHSSNVNGNQIKETPGRPSCQLVNDSSV